MREDPRRGELSTTDVKALLERYPSRPWTSENLSQVLYDLLASDVIGYDSDSSIDATAHDDSDLDILHGYEDFGYGQEPRPSRLTFLTDSTKLQSKKFQSSKYLKHTATAITDKYESDPVLVPTGKSIKLHGSFSGKLKKAATSTDIKTPRLRISEELQVSSLGVKDSDLIDLGNISTRLLRKLKPEPKQEDLPTKIILRVNEMVDAIKTVAKYNLQPENLKDEDEVDEKIELNRLLKSYKNEMNDSGVKEVWTRQYKGPSIKGIPTFRYVPLQPNKREKKTEICDCQPCKMNRLWVDTKRRRSDELAASLGEPKKRGQFGKVWNCQCKGPRPGFNNKNQMVMKIRVPQNMRPDELKKLNSVPRYEIYKHITPAVNGKGNIKNAVIYKPQSSRPIIQQEMMCHTNEMRCVLLPPPFTPKVTKFETPEWVVEYNKRYVYDYFFHQSKNIPNVPFMHFSYKKNLAVLIEEIIHGCMNRTDVFDDDTCQCTFLCTCAHKTVQNPNASLLDTVRQAKKYCAADLHDENVYEAGDYMKSGDKTYYVCSKLCNVKMKLHKQLHE